MGHLNISLEPLDLTLPISEKLPTFPGSPKPHFISWSRIKKDGYNLELLFLSSHTGTHIDAPYHFYEKGSKIHQIHPKRLIREAILIKIPKKHNEGISKKNIIDFEKKFGKIGVNSTIIFQTGWQKNLKNKIFFETNPGLTEEAAKYLVLKKINLIGIDSPSIDIGKDSKFKVHQVFSKADILIVENLCNLEKISSIRFNLIVLPLKLENATGSPVRAIAV